MSESEGQRSDSPLLSERGVTTISGTVVSSLAGMAAQEVEGVHMGGGGSRAASGVLGSITGSESQTSGVSVEVGRTETAIDLKMGIEYDKNILQTVEEVRRRITDRVEGLTGLRIKELNATITDITFPEKEARHRPASEGSADDSEDTPETLAGSGRERAEVEPTSRTDTEEEPVREEEVSVEDRPPEEGETTEVSTGDTQTSEQPAGEAPEADTQPPEEAQTRAEDEISEREDAEARMRRRAEERARRRRRRADDS